jgi:hypothetical protein
MHYRIEEPKEKSAAEIFSATMKMLETDPEMNADRKRLADYCCSPSALVAIVSRRSKPV